jgi:dihydrofolate synthase / folylpolyglutamate synthase
MDMNYTKAVDYIFSKQQFSMDLTLDRVERLLEKLGSPHKKIKTVHVAGTNGKGSVCCFLSNILVCAGYKVGLYTSPHLVDFRERLQINGLMISRDDVVRYVSELKRYVTNETFFEILTALGFMFFAEQGCDIVILESGLGHPLDATNAVTPILSIITNISYDHMYILGNTIEEIAASKAGIIKYGIPVVTAATRSALKVIRKVCQEKDSPLCEVLIKDIKTGMHGFSQSENASIAASALNILRENGFNISSDSEHKGFRNAYWPGRLDYIKDDLLCDCAHNVSGMEKLISYLHEQEKDDCIFIFSCMKDKDISGMCSELAKIKGPIILTAVSNDRSIFPDALKKYIPNGIIKKDLADAYSFAKEISDGRLIVVAGSIFLIGELYDSLGIAIFLNYP